MSSVPSPRLPSGVRWAAILCAVLGSTVGACAGGETLSLLMGHPTDSRTGSSQTAPFTPSWMSPEMVRAMEQTQETQVGLLKDMRRSRTLILGVLSLSCAMAFSASLRLLRPAGFPREAARRTLAFSCFAAAVLRTADGAQMTVVFKRSIPPFLDATMVWLESGSSAEPVELTRQLSEAFTLAFPVGLTFVVAGSFLALGQLFRSSSIRTKIQALDGKQDPGPTE